MQDFLPQSGNMRKQRYKTPGRHIFRKPECFVESAKKRMGIVVGTFVQKIENKQAKKLKCACNTGML